MPGGVAAAHTGASAAGFPTKLSTMSYASGCALPDGEPDGVITLARRRSVVARGLPREVDGLPTLGDAFPSQLLWRPARLAPCAKPSTTSSGERSVGLGA